MRFLREIEALRETIRKETAPRQPEYGVVHAIVDPAHVDVRPLKGSTLIRGVQLIGEAVVGEQVKLWWIEKRPYALGRNSALGSVQAAPIVGGGGQGSEGPYAPTPHALDSIHHSGTLRDDQAPQFLKADGSRPLTGHLSVSNGITIDGVDLDVHAADPDAHHQALVGLADDAGTAATPDANDVITIAGGSGLMSAASPNKITLSVGAGAGITVNADDVALTTPGILSVASTNDPNGNHTHEIDWSSNPGQTSSLIGTDNSGRLRLYQVGLGMDPTLPLDVSGQARISGADAQLLLANGAQNGFIHLEGDGDLTLMPAASLNLVAPDSIWLGPSGGSVFPTQKYFVNLGSLQNKYLALHAAELWVETLVAQDTVATIGGRILVGPTTSLIADVTTGATTIDVKHNNLANGDRVYLEAGGKVEFMAITSAATAIPGGYRYSVTRNLDGSGANEWYAGDAVFNTGQAGSGFIDIYSMRGVKSASQAGPTIVGNVRNSGTYNDWTEHWAIGNLKGVYGYGSDTYGVAFGPYQSGKTWLSVDATNGFRIRNGTADVIGQWKTDGTIVIGREGAEHVRLDTSGLDIRSNAISRAIFGAAARIGEIANDRGWVEIHSTNGVQIRQRNANGVTRTKIQLGTDGNASFGYNTANVVETALIIFGSPTTYNGESVGAADLMIGDNTTGRGNIYWDHSSKDLYFRSGTTNKMTFDASAGLIMVGDAAGPNVLIESGQVTMRSGSTERLTMVSNGNLYAGENANNAASIYFALFGTNTTWNGEALGVGDLLIGLNTAGNANILWDKSAKQLKFRGGTTVQLYIDTDGSLTAGGGVVTLNSQGITITPSSAAEGPRTIKIGQLEIFGTTGIGGGEQNLYLTAPSNGGSINLRGPNVNVERGLYVGNHYPGSVIPLAGKGDIAYSGDLIPDRGGSVPGFIFVPTAKLTHTAWDGDAKASNAGSPTAINIYQFGFPQAAKAVYIRVAIQAPAAARHLILGQNASNMGAIVARTQAANQYIDVSGIVPMDGSGRIYYETNGVSNAFIEVYGYFI